MAKVATLEASRELAHAEHAEVVGKLTQLDRALRELTCYSEVFANLATAKDVCRAARELSEFLPEHFGHEEGDLFEVASDLSPELNQFSDAMRKQHMALRGELAALVEAARELELMTDIDSAVCSVKELGERFSRHMRAHMHAEEQGFIRLGRA